MVCGLSYKRKRSRPLNEQNTDYSRNREERAKHQAVGRTGRRPRLTAAVELFLLTAPYLEAEPCSLSVRVPSPQLGIVGAHISGILNKPTCSL